VRTFEASSVIRADPAAVWAVLTDGPAWPTWDSAVANPKRGFPVRVVEFVPAERMTWRGGMPLGLFTGTRTYVLTPQPDASVRFAMRETYTGPLAGLIGRSIPDLGPSFVRFANGLKQRVEGAGR
jgi:hypothetical protein